MKYIFLFLSISCLTFAQRTIKGNQIYYVDNYSEQQAIQYFNQSKDLDPIEGLWVKSDVGYEYSIEKDFDGKNRNPLKFRAVLVKVSGETIAEVGDIQFFLSKGAANNLYKSTYFLYRASWKGGKREYNIEPFTCVSILNGAYLTSKVPQFDDFGGFEEATEEQYFKVYPMQKSVSIENNSTAMSSGTGFLASSDGYIITNYHVIKDAVNGDIKITGINEDYQKIYKATVAIEDKQNDLAILKIQDSSLLPINIPYTFKFSTSNIGENCFVLGYPLVSTMGKDIKLTTGIISSQTGYDGNISQYQFSAPVQPGNSGAPLFDGDGYVIGVVQAKHSQAENAGYAIKAMYIKSLWELLPQTIKYNSTNLLKGKDLQTQVRLASKATCLIIINGTK